MKRNSEHILTEYLVLNAQLGSHDALAALAQQWYPRLQRYATRQLGCQELARDLVQQVFEVIVRDVGKLKDPASFPLWAYQIVHRRSVDVIRSQRRHRR